MAFMSTPSDRRAGWLAGTAPALGREHQYWLTRPGALTAGLQRLGRVRLRVLRERAEGLCRNEACMLGLAPRSPIWAREIVMSINGVDSVLARCSVFRRGGQPLSVAECFLPGFWRLAMAHQPAGASERRHGPPFPATRQA